MKIGGRRAHSAIEAVPPSRASAKRESTGTEQGGAASVRSAQRAEQKNKNKVA
jgi:hypothetical protein